MNTVQAAWESYLREVVPQYSSATQVRETKQAFYGGALIMFEMMTMLPESENAAVAIMQGIAEELEVFTEGLPS